MGMKKNYIKVMSLVAVLGLTACGSSGGGSKGESPREIMSKKKGVMIFRSYPSTLCTSGRLREKLEENRDMKNLIIQVESNDVTCDTYGKRDSYCEVFDVTNIGNESCVLGMDFEPNSNRTYKLSIPKKVELLETMIIEADEAQSILLK